jgi:hypothetical protein
MAYVRFKRGALGALGTLCALVNLRCGSPSGDLFQSGGGTAALPFGGVSGGANFAGSGDDSSTAGGGTQLGGAGGLSSAGANGGVGTGGSDIGTGGAGNASSAGTSSGGSNAGAAGSAGAIAGGGDAGNGNGGASTGGSSGASGAGGGGGNTGGSSGASGAGGGGGNAGSASAGSSGNASGGASAGSGGGGCGAQTPTFTPRAQTLEFLVDRSSTMFEGAYWAPVRSAVLGVINALQDQIKFGVSAYTGVVGQTCPLDLVNLGSPALNDYDAINTAYSALEGAGMKTESPTAAALAAIAAALPSNSGPSTSSSAKFVFLITDGGQDFCNDGMPSCASDAVVYELQALKAAGVTSKTFGIKGSAGLTGADLQDFENAGAGVAVAGSAQTIYGACHNVSLPWTAAWSSLARGVNQALGAYQPTGGSTPSVLLDTTSPDSMSQALMSAAAQTKSCTFDVTGASIDLANAAQASVQIDGVSVPFSAVNGWRMNSATVLELVGSACSKWQTPTSLQISFDFPCQTLE